MKRPTVRLQAGLKPHLRNQFCDDGYVITAQATADAVEVWLHGIVGDGYAQTDSMSIGQVLSANRDKPLTLHVNSPGGLAYDGVAIYSAISQHKAPTLGIIEGLAGSAASLAIMACDRIEAHVGSVFHPHYSLALAFGHKADIVEVVKDLELFDADAERIYSVRSGGDMETIRQHLTGPMGDGTPFSAEDALAAGYVDEVIQLTPRKAQATRQHVADAQAAMSGRLQYLRLRQKQLTATSG